MSVLREQKEHHVEEEEKELFPKAKKQLGADRLEELGQEMETMVDELMAEGAPRMRVRRRRSAPRRSEALGGDGSRVTPPFTTRGRDQRPSPAARAPTP
jgi:hypothetical protein